MWGGVVPFAQRFPQKFPLPHHTIPHSLSLAHSLSSPPQSSPPCAPAFSPPPISSPFGQHKKNPQSRCPRGGKGPTADRGAASAVALACEGALVALASSPLGAQGPGRPFPSPHPLPLQEADAWPARAFVRLFLPPWAGGGYRERLPRGAPRNRLACTMSKSQHTTTTINTAQPATISNPPTRTHARVRTQSQSPSPEAAMCAYVCVCACASMGTNNLAWLCKTAHFDGRVVLFGGLSLGDGRGCGQRRAGASTPDEPRIDESRDRRNRFSSETIEEVYRAHDRTTCSSFLSNAFLVLHTPRAI